MAQRQEVQSYWSKEPVVRIAIQKREELKEQRRIEKEQKQKQVLQEEEERYQRVLLSKALSIKKKILKTICKKYSFVSTQI